MIGILVMAYGSPNKPEDIEPYYTDIRRGHKPPPELLHELTERYEAIGGSSPLLRITQEQASTIEQALGEGYKAYVGMRHWTPWIHEAVAQMKEEGITQAIGIVMAPHFSDMSVAKYIAKVEEAKEKLDYDLDIDFVESWHDHPLYIAALADKVRAAELKFTPEEKKSLTYVFTAHSLPEKILAQNDPYRDQLLESSALLADELGIPDDRWTFAFQSAGRTQEKWLGPDLLEVLDKLHEEGNNKVLVCSVGFITDHLEVMYDIDIEGQAKAKERGMHLERAASLNADPRLGLLFKELVLNKLDE